MSEHEGHRKRLRDRANETGLVGFQPHEVLELMLMETIPRRDVNPLAHALIAHFGSFSAVLDASREELMQIEGVGERTAEHLSRQPDYFAYYERDRWERRTVCLTTPQQACAYCTTLFGRQREEFVAIVCLDIKKAVISHQILNHGTLSEAPVYPRMVAEAALRHHAHSVLLVHNHPSGQLQPSQGDIAISGQVYRALQALEIELIDHIIVAGPRALSMKEMQRENVAEFSSIRPFAEVRRELYRAADAPEGESP